jgi:hypothetical protein
VEESPFSEEELFDAYLRNVDTGIFYPIQKVKNEDAKDGYRYHIFPVLNRLIYENPQILKMENFALNLQSKFQTIDQYRTGT